jgi:hypothetical protein
MVYGVRHEAKDFERRCPEKHGRAFLPKRDGHGPNSVTNGDIDLSNR